MSTELEPVTMRVPDEVEPREAWRVFIAVQPMRRFDKTENDQLRELWLPDKDRWQLRSMSGPTLWTPGIEASCPHGTHEAPHMECTCGLWSVKSLRELQRVILGGLESQKTAAVVLGRVQVHGRVVEHEHGYRSQRADISDLWVVTHVPPHEDYYRSGYGSFAFGGPGGDHGLPDDTGSLVRELKQLYHCEVKLGRWESVVKQHQPALPAVDGLRTPDAIGKTPAEALLSPMPDRSLLRIRRFMLAATAVNVAAGAWNVGVGFGLW